jgi:hypothetical protein
MELLDLNNDSVPSRRPTTRPAAAEWQQAEQLINIFRDAKWRAGCRAEQRAVDGVWL